MADAIDSIGVAPEIIGRLVVHTGYSVNGDGSSSSLEPGQTIHRTPVGQSLHKDVVVPVDNGQTRSVSSKGYAPSFGMKSPNANPARVPAATQRGAMLGVMARQARR